MKRTKNLSGRRAVKRLAMLLPLCGAALMPAAEFKVTCTPQMSPALVLPAPAKIMKVTWTTGIKGYTIWKDGTPFVTVHPYRLEEGNGVKGVLPPGRYILRATGGSVTIHLQTGYSPEKITLWGIQNAVVTPRTDGNRIVLATPTAIVEAAYDGTDGMGIFMGDKRVLYYVSPHNVRNHGPKVIGGTGGKTLVGQVLPAGVYMLVPGRGTATGRVFGKVVLEVK